MSQLDQAFIRAYQSEPNRLADDAAPPTSDADMNKPHTSQQTTPDAGRTMSRKPTLSELQHWKNQGIRIDMPGSPLVGSYDNANDSPGQGQDPDEFQVAAKNTAAVAEALDRLMVRAGRKHIPVNPVSAATPRPAVAEMPAPTIEISPWEPDEFTDDDSSNETSFTFVATEEPSTPTPAAEAEPEPAPAATPQASPYRARRLSHPKWEVDTLCWPEETDMILDLCGDQWRTLATGISNGVKSMAIVSLGAGCGCTTLTACLAKLLAKQNRRVLIIDEGEGPESLTARMGLQAEGVPADSASLDNLYEAMIQAADQPIAILPAGYRHLGDLSAGQLQQFARDFDAVLWDGGDRPEVWQRLALIHSVLVVRDGRGTHDHELGQILPKLQQRKINVVGVADNFWR
ncbi:hypothetical protein GC197_07555 [bacterium]|nr:hypothetical protein [bacterium]